MFTREQFELHPDRALRMIQLVLQVFGVDVFAEQHVHEFRLLLQESPEQRSTVRHGHHVHLVETEKESEHFTRPGVEDWNLSIVIRHHRQHSTDVSVEQITDDVDFISLEEVVQKVAA